MDYDFKVLSAALVASKTVYFEPLWGNHGDHLIYLGARKFLDLAGMRYVDRPEAADAVIINGSGGMTDLWGALSVLERYIANGAKKVIVLPSSIHVPQHELESLKKLADSYRCELVWFAREQASYERLKRVFSCNKNLFLSHDMALFLSQDDIFSATEVAEKGDSFALLVERGDEEVVKPARYHSPSESLLQKVIGHVPFRRYTPHWLKQKVWRLNEFSKNQKASFVGDIAAELIDPNMKIVNTDISSKSLYSFGEFVNTVFNAEEVVTTRLHVAILRNILRKPCYLVPTGGTYQKNEAIHQWSLSRNGYVKLLEL